MCGKGWRQNVKDRLGRPKGLGLGSKKGLQPEQLVGGGWHLPRVETERTPSGEWVNSCSTLNVLNWGCWQTAGF